MDFEFPKKNFIVYLIAIVFNISAVHINGQNTFYIRRILYACADQGTKTCFSGIHVFRIELSA